MNLLKSAMSPLYRLLELADTFALNQSLNPATPIQYNTLITRHLADTSQKHVLDIGCGIGTYRPRFPGAYTGVDINPAYIEKAREKYSGTFAVMDCAKLEFPDATFDEVVSIATLHHIDDKVVEQMVREALRVCKPGGYLHIIDPVLPISPSVIKTVFFKLDRGNHQRTLDEQLAVIARAAAVLESDVMTGPMHDTVYVRAGRAEAR